jgi:hypothetical protein
VLRVVLLFLAVLVSVLHKQQHEVVVRRTLHCASLYR